MKFQLIALDNRDIWQEELCSIAHSYYHTWEYAYAFFHREPNKVKLLVISGDKGKLVCCLSFREKRSGSLDIYTPYGFGGIILECSQGNESLFYDAWLTFAKQHDFVTAYIQQHPLLTDCSKWGSDIYDHHRVYEIDLRLPIDELWKNLQKGHRYEVNKLLKSTSVQISSDKESLSELIMPLYQSTIERVGASNTYNFSEQTLQFLCETTQCLMFGASIQGKIEAIIIVVYNGEIAEYFLSATSNEGRIYTRLLLWEAIKALKKKGIHSINLGGGLKTDDSLDAFKRRFGGKHHTLKVIKQVINENKYNELCTDFGCSAEYDNKYFPPYWSA
jgi:hypothetical protein